MKTLLIVEDEKLIRQGIRTMAERSGVPIEHIYEANNGEAALQILNEQDIEVVFTDIRMPKMDGIELVNRLATLDKKPYIVAVSGYDDFSYAVEMLRNGVREYILKPVEREKIKSVLEKIEEEITQAREKTGEYDKILSGRFAVAILPPSTDDILKKKYCVLHGVTDQDGFVLREEDIEIFMEDFSDLSGGISEVYETSEDLKNAINSARNVREFLFCRQLATSDFERCPKYGERVPQSLREHAAELLSDSKRTYRIRLIGMRKEDELLRSWGFLFEEAKNGNLLPEEFAGEMREAISEIIRIYKNAIDDEYRESINRLSVIYDYVNISEYEMAFMETIIDINKRILQLETEEPNRKKIALAVEYVRDNYVKNINMAVVSNYVSMNYTLFSIEFKKYTGQNFVNYIKDIRLSEARRLLEETDERIIDIAHMVGYENEKHFLKTFKSEFTISPSEYRKTCRK